MNDMDMIHLVFSTMWSTAKQVGITAIFAPNFVNPTWAYVPQATSQPSLTLLEAADAIGLKGYSLTQAPS